MKTEFSILLFTEECRTRMDGSDVWAKYFVCPGNSQLAELVKQCDLEDSE